MSGPLPPHERSWRHPSELPAPPHEPPSRSGRLLILGTATVGLLLVGVLALRMTPGRSGVTRDAVVGATTTSAALVDFTEPASAAATAGGDTFAEVNISEAFNRIVETLAALPSSSTEGIDSTAAPAAEAPLTGQTVVALPPVTPVGTGEYGVTTAAALDGRSGPIEAILPSGSVVPAEIVGVDEGVAVVALLGNHSEAVEFSQQFAGGGQSDELTVVVEGQSLDVHGDELAASGASEGAPILDGDGGLVGLATIGDNGTVQMLPLTSLPDVGTPTSAPESSMVDSTAPASEPPDPTTQPSTTSEPATPTSPPPPVEPESTTSTTTTTDPSSSSLPDESSTTLLTSTTVETARRTTSGDATV